MPIDIQKVLVCDAVDPSCVELLKSNGISVDYKLKLPKDVLIEEAKVKKVKRNIPNVTCYVLKGFEPSTFKFYKYSPSENSPKLLLRMIPLNRHEVHTRAAEKKMQPIINLSKLHKIAFRSRNEREKN